MNPWTPGGPLRFLESGLRHLSEDDVRCALGKATSCPAPSQTGTGWMLLKRSAGHRRGFRFWCSTGSLTEIPLTWCGTPLRLRRAN